MLLSGYFFISFLLRFVVVTFSRRFTARLERGKFGRGAVNPEMDEPFLFFLQRDHRNLSFRFGAFSILLPREDSL